MDIHALTGYARTVPGCPGCGREKEPGADRCRVCGYTKPPPPPPSVFTPRPPVQRAESPPPPPPPPPTTAPLRVYNKKVISRPAEKYHICLPSLSASEQEAFEAEDRAFELSAAYREDENIRVWNHALIYEGNRQSHLIDQAETYFRHLVEGLSWPQHISDLQELGGDPLDLLRDHRRRHYVQR